MIRGGAFYDQRWLCCVGSVLRRCGLLAKGDGLRQVIDIDVDEQIHGLLRDCRLRTEIITRARCREVAPSAITWTQLASGTERTINLATTAALHPIRTIRILRAGTHEAD